jgi:acyl carrier protein
MNRLERGSISGFVCFLFEDDMYFASVVLIKIRSFMYLAKVKDIAANILFLDSSDDIDDDASFEEMGCSSIDFIDFCYEVKAQINSDIEPHDIWPFTRLLIDPKFYTEGCWTEAGKKLVNEVLEVDSSVEINPKSLNQYWTPKFCAQRIEKVLNA